jgi:hypothetical protein
MYKICIARFPFSLQLLSLGLLSLISLGSPLTAKEQSERDLKANTCSAEEISLIEENGFSTGLCVDDANLDSLIPLVENDKQPIEVVLVNSVTSAEDELDPLATRMVEDDSALIVVKKCLSACADKIVPSTGRVVLQREAVIATSTISIPEPNRSGKDSGLAEWSAADFVENGKIFATDPGFWIRPREQVRSIVEGNSRSCLYNQPFRLVIDDKYLRAFGKEVIRSVRISPDEAFNAAVAAMPETNFVWGFDNERVRMTQRTQGACTPPIDSDSNIF